MKHLVALLILPAALLPPARVNAVKAVWFVLVLVLDFSCFPGVWLDSDYPNPPPAATQPCAPPDAPSFGVPPLGGPRGATPIAACGRETAYKTLSHVGQSFVNGL
jgi:hypothetical protein